MNAQNNKNIISVVYDALTGAYLLTQPETFVERDVFMNIVSFIENESGRDTLYQRLASHHVPITSGRALFSAILPEDFYYRKNDVFIHNGILVSGIVHKDHLGSTHGSIIQVLMKDYGQDTTVNFLTDVYNIMREWLDVRGFSVGLDDCYLRGDNPEKTIEYEVQRAKMLVRSMGWKMEDPLEEERREKQIMAYLNTARDLGARISEENLPKYNSFNVMAKSGAKGSTFNIAQITGILGQQFVQGQRMPEVLSGGKRVLPYFGEDSLDPAARGFVSNSFLAGLTPAEMFFHQAGSREGLTDTAVKSVSGDTPIIITENGVPKRVMIGDWIDSLLENNQKNIEYYPNDRDMELLKITDAKIPTTDLDGNVSWGDITAITRHDPGNTLYKVTTTGGREVVVTEAHSLLIWNPITSKLERRGTPTVTVGNCMPVTKLLPKVFDSKTRDNKWDILSKSIRYVKDYLINYVNHNVNYSSDYNETYLEFESKEELEFVNMLFTRIGEYMDIKGNRLYFKYDLTNDNIQNNVVLDKIVSIEKIDPKSDPKYYRVYDLTVPSTLNFGLANGLHVVDTAETGSMHHRIVKALEDVKVYEDGSARNAFGVIFQYVYGEDGFDASMLETVNTKTGPFTSFINTKRLAGRINARYGYTTPGEPVSEEIEPKRPATMLPTFDDFPAVPEIPAQPNQPEIFEIGNVVNTAAGPGVIQQVEGERILVQREGANPEWVKVGKLEL